MIVGNWKMHGSRASAHELVSEIKDALSVASPGEVALCVPFPFLEQVQHLLQGSAIAWGAQSVSEHRSGAYTGEVSASMLQDFGCTVVIVGHSERRTAHHETDHIVGLKAVAALEAGLTPIVCLGETLAERETGQTEAIVLRQLDALMSHVSADHLPNCVIAYEPLWAIGTGQTATAQQAAQVHALIRQQLAGVDGEAAQRTRVLYGGSVKPASAAELFAQPDIDGGLIGGASLVASDFLAIVGAAG
ncbi:triosephosphate isomerase [Cupriavidus sp. TA19]|nr:triose-phosphate isomerase [Cupriavidus sp. P-10]GLC93214.1 triosephosphate isomerase [Cupriavidus sp. TA19]